MPLKNSAEIREYHRNYELEHKEHLKEVRKKWRNDHKDEISRKRKERYNIPEIRKKYQQKSRERLNELQKKIKEIIVEKGKCDQCGYSDVRALIVHHPLGNNSKHNSYKSYKEIVEGKVPYSVLCMNCHVILHGTLRNTRFWEC